MKIRCWPQSGRLALPFCLVSLLGVGSCSPAADHSPDRVGDANFDSADLANVRTLTCLDGSPMAAAFFDDFASGIRDAYWTVSLVAASPFAIDTSSGAVRLSKTSNAMATATESITVSLNLSAISGAIPRGEAFGRCPRRALRCQNRHGRYGACHFWAKSLRCLGLDEDL